MTDAAADDDHRQVLRHYALGNLTGAWRIERGFVNENWALETTQGRYFLKRRAPSLRDREVIHAQHALIAHLGHAAFPAPTILPTTSGETLLVLEGAYYEVQGYIEGEPYDHDRLVHFEQAASTLGRYHTCVRGFDASALRVLGDLYTAVTLSANLDKLAKAWALDRDPDLDPVIHRLKAHTTDLARRFAGHGPLPELVIHGDYYAGNLLFREGRVVGVVDYDKARWQPRVVELAEALIYFASPRPGHLKRLVYPGFLEWEPFARFLRNYARSAKLEPNELRALPDYVRSIWVSVSLQRLREAGPRPAHAMEALHEVLALGDWAATNTRQMVETGCSAINAA